MEHMIMIAIVAFLFYLLINKCNKSCNISYNRKCNRENFSVSLQNANSVSLKTKKIVKRNMKYYLNKINPEHQAINIQH
jgi:hypothetical protein